MKNNFETKSQPETDFNLSRDEVSNEDDEVTSESANTINRYANLLNHLKFQLNRKQSS